MYGERESALIYTSGPLLVVKVNKKKNKQVFQVILSVVGDVAIDKVLHGLVDRLRHVSR